MPLATLLIAGEVALPRLMGTDPIESQLRRARAAGAAHAVIFAPRVTSELLATVDRLRREGQTVDLARTVGDAAEYIHPDETVLVVTPDLILSPARMETVANSADPVLLCVANDPTNERFELVDPNARWTGFARLDGGLLRRTAAMVGDWDLASTLMRCAVQDGAGRMMLSPEEQALDLLPVGDSAAARSVGQKLVAGTATETPGWGTAWIAAPLARIFARVAAETNVEAQWLTLGSFGLFGLATGASLAGWLVVALMLLLFAYIFDIAGDIGTKAAMATPQFERFRFPVRAGAGSIVAMAVGVTLALRSVQWGCIVLALVIIGATWLVTPLARAETALQRWRADPAGHAVIGLLGFMIGAPIWALALCAAHAAGTLGWAVRKSSQG